MGTDETSGDDINNKVDAQSMMNKYLQSVQALMPENITCMICKKVLRQSDAHLEYWDKEIGFIRVCHPDTIKAVSFYIDRMIGENKK